MSLKGLFNKSITPQTLTKTSDGQGGFTESWADGTAFKGRVSNLMNREITEANKVTTKMYRKLFCAADESLNSGMRVKVGSDVYEITGVSKPSELDTGIGHLEVDIVLVSD